MVLHENVDNDCEVAFAAGTQDLITNSSDNVRIDEQLLTCVSSATHEVRVFTGCN